MLGFLAGFWCSWQVASDSPWSSRTLLTQDFHRQDRYGQVPTDRIPLSDFCFAYMRLVQGRPACGAIRRRYAGGANQGDTGKQNLSAFFSNYFVRIQRKNHLTFQSS
jgi:hypothetical protein